MKKAVLSGAAALGLLLLTAASMPQDPPNFDDVLRGMVGRKCLVTQADGAWRLWISARPGREVDVRGDRLEQAEAERQEIQRQLQAVMEQLDTASGQQREHLEQARDELLSQLTVAQSTERRLRQGQERRPEVRPPDTILVAVGRDFVQVREADGTERFLRLDRVVEVVVRPEK